MFNWSEDVKQMIISKDMNPDHDPEDIIQVFT